MSHGILVDLYVPASAGSAEEVWAAGREAGLDGLVYVVESHGDLQTARETADRLAEEGAPRIAAGLVFHSTDGLRLVAQAPVHATLDEAPAVEGSAAELEAAAALWGSLAIPAWPRHDADGGPVQRDPEGSVSAHGWLVLGGHGSLLGRDLAMEACFAEGHAALGGTGPFGTLEDVGRSATWLAGGAGTTDGWIDALRRGHALAIERLARRNEAPQELSEKSGRKRKRRRRRKPGRKGEEGATQPGAEASQPSSIDEG